MRGNTLHARVRIRTLHARVRLKTLHARVRGATPARACARTNHSKQVQTSLLRLLPGAAPLTLGCCLSALGAALVIITHKIWRARSILDRHIH